MIKIEKLNKVFNPKNLKTLALNNINLQVNSGEFIAIMGPSGSGKSTLLNIIGMLLPATNGSYNFNNNEIINLKKNERSSFLKGNLGFVFQSFNLIDELTVYENIELPLRYLKIKKSERKERVMKILNRMKIAHRVHHFPNQLSGGQQQRVAIARAIVTNPKLILADEPTGNLDSKNGMEVMKLLIELNQQGTTIIMATHSERDAHYAHRVINLFDGKIVTESKNN